MKSQSKTTIFVNPIARISAQGRHKQMFVVQQTTGEFMPTTGMGKNKEFDVPSEYSFRLNTSTNKLITGLDKMIENPFKGLDPSNILEDYSLSQDWLPQLQQIVKQDQIKLQTKYEIMDNVGYNFYTSDVAYNMFSSNWKANIDKPKNFLETFKIILYDRPNMFTDETPRGRLSLALIKNHPKIAKTKIEGNTAVHDWYISEENEAQMEKAKKRSIIQDAIKTWGNLADSTTPYIIYQLASLLKTHDGSSIVRGKMNDASVREKVSDYIFEPTSSQLENIEKFNKIAAMLSNKDDKQRFQAMYLIQQAINTDVVGVRNGFFIWHSKSALDNIYKHTSYDAFVSTIQREYSNYNPKDKDVANWYKDLFDEVTNKGAWVE